MQRALDLDTNSLVYEIASNDGYLLQNFVAMAVPVCGIEPAANVAQSALAKGVRTEVRFLGVDSANDIVGKYGQADLVVGNNVLAHVPDINDFVSGIARLLKPYGTVTMEFPHLVKLMDLNQFDTIYHEHFSYLSWFTVQQVFAGQGLRLYDVDVLATHGGSIRIHACHADAPSRPLTAAARALQQAELDWGVNRLATYADFTKKVIRAKHELLAFLIAKKAEGKTIIGYGAPGKGNTLLNYCGIRQDFLDYTVDRNPYKQGAFTPGTRIPILAPEAIAETRPDFVLLLPWNLKTELSQQLAYIHEWGGQLVVPIPKLQVL